MVDDITSPHELSNALYVYTRHCGSDYIGRTLKRFNVRRDQHVTEKFIFDGESGPKKRLKANNHMFMNTP